MRIVTVTDMYVVIVAFEPFNQLRVVVIQIISQVVRNFRFSKDQFDESGSLH